MANAVFSGQKSAQSSVKLRRAEIAWVSNASGDVNESVVGVGTDGSTVSGVIVRVTFIPDSGATQPDDLYDMTLTDVDGVDILSGQGSNLSNASASSVCPGIPLKDGTTTSVSPMAVHSELTLVVANAGNAKGGKVVLYMR